jgi:hypothetical protein
MIVMHKTIWVSLILLILLASVGFAGFSHFNSRIAKVNNEIPRIAAIEPVLNPVKEAAKSDDAMAKIIAAEPIQPIPPVPGIPEIIPPETPRWARLFPPFWTVIFLAECGGDTFPERANVNDPIPDDDQTITMRNMGKTWDNHGESGPNIEIYLEVDVLGDPDSGNDRKRYMLPDEAMVVKGGTMTWGVAPAQMPNFSIGEDDITVKWRMKYKNTRDGGFHDFPISIECEKVILANHAPVALPDSANVQNDSSNLIDVLANDSDPDWDNFYITYVSDPEHGEAYVEGDKIRYTPDVDAPPSDSFTYTISDGLATDSALVSVTISSTNHAPVLDFISDQKWPTHYDASVYAHAEDPDGDTIIYSLSGNPDWLKINSSTGKIYENPIQTTPWAGNVTVIADDQRGETDSQVVHFDVGDYVQILGTWANPGCAIPGAWPTGAFTVQTMVENSSSILVYGVTVTITEFDSHFTPVDEYGNPISPDDLTTTVNIDSLDTATINFNFHLNGDAVFGEYYGWTAELPEFNDSANPEGGQRLLVGTGCKKLIAKK